MIETQHEYRMSSLQKNNIRRLFMEEKKITILNIVNSELYVASVIKNLHIYKRGL